jgi:hypothetical protein
MKSSGVKEKNQLYMKMKAIALLVALMAVSVSCKKEEVTKESNCSPTIKATVRDLKGLDGCGFVFELEDGSRLEPIMPTLEFCYIIDSPIDPLLEFVFVDGKEVKINYEKVERVSICMVGPTVRITCIEEVNPDLKN